MPNYGPGSALSALSHKLILAQVGSRRMRQGTVPASPELSFVEPLGGTTMVSIFATLAVTVTGVAIAALVCWFLDIVSTDDSDWL